MIKEIEDPNAEYRIVRSERELREKLRMVMEDPDNELDFFTGLKQEVPPASTFMVGAPKPLPVCYHVKKVLRMLLIIAISFCAGWTFHMIEDESAPAEVNAIKEQLSNTRIWPDD